LAQILGDRGKKVAYEYLALGEREIKTDTAVLDVYFLDEMQRLSRQAANNLLSKLERSAGTGLRLIMSSHRDMGALFNRRQLPLKTFQLDISLTFQRFQAILDHRLATFAITDAKRTTLAPEAVEFLYATFYPNMRQAEYFLYDVWQKETAVRVITAVDLEQYYEAVTTKPTN
jgi:hypothetical protein